MSSAPAPVPPSPQFTHFPTLPIEIRLKIWHASLPHRAVEVQLHVPRESEAAISEISLDLRPLARPTLPVVFHVCREARDEALSVYRRVGSCVGSGAGDGGGGSSNSNSNSNSTTFGSPHPFPYNLFHPDLDALFVPISLYTMEAYLQRYMFSAAAALEIGTPREFILDRLAAGGGDVAAIKSLAISWADMHVKDVPTLIKALEPFVGLRELSLMFFEMRQDNEDIRLLSMKRGQLRAVLVDPSESSVRGRYLERVLEEFVELAASLNTAFREEDSLRDLSRRGQKKLPQVNIKMVRFVS